MKINTKFKMEKKQFNIKKNHIPYKCQKNHNLTFKIRKINSVNNFQIKP